MADKKEIALEARDIEGARLFSPSAARNRDVIRDVFLAHGPTKGAILEVGSGTGEHAAHIAGELPNVTWMPGDPDAASRASIAAWAQTLKLKNIAPPHDFDVSVDDWDGDWTPANGETLRAVVSINMIHIAPFEAAKGLIAGAGRRLSTGGILFLYGPFARDGRHISLSNKEFDASLKARDPRWGVRDLERDIIPLASEAGFILGAVIDMPANNFSVILRKNAPKLL